MLVFGRVESSHIFIHITMVLEKINIEHSWIDDLAKVEI